MYENRYRVDLLPHSLQLMAEDLGSENMGVLVASYANRMLHVPAQKPTAVMVELLGLGLAEKIVECYARISLSIPVCKKWQNYYRDLEMLKLKRDGKSQLELCQMYHLSSRYISDCLRRAALAEVGSADSGN